MLHKINDLPIRNQEEHLNHIWSQLKGVSIKISISYYYTPTISCGQCMRDKEFVVDILVSFYFVSDAVMLIRATGCDFTL